MSFNVHAAHVRDPALAYRRRVSALRSCVQLYRPIGFTATLSFLREVAGPFERDEAALLRALDALMTSRAGWHADLRRYAADRRAAKRRGQRSPHPLQPNPNDGPHHWYGAPRQAAVHALTLWRGDHPAAPPSWLDPIAARVAACVTACLAVGGPLTPAQRQHLTAAVDALGQRVGSDLWHDDRAAYFRAWELLKVARLVRTAADAAADADAL